MILIAPARRALREEPHRLLRGYGLKPALPSAPVYTARSGFLFPMATLIGLFKTPFLIPPGDRC